ncbi:MAG: methylmalonyl-CoA mutase family protein, partial [bacterium]|nr:methylmalonyl-CoA mutase family protein [bacterium]
NAYTEGDDGDTPILYIDEDVEDQQLARLAGAKQRRDGGAVAAALETLAADAADPTINLMEPIIDCVRAEATEGEITGALEGVFGTYTEPAVV